MELQLQKNQMALKEISDKAIPFTVEVLQLLTAGDVLDQFSFKDIQQDLKTKGNQLLEILRKIESILK